MKKSKILLAVTTTILAIAGAAAAKISNFSSTVTRYYCTHIRTASLRICVPYTYANCESQLGGPITCYFTVGTSIAKNYTLYSDGDSEVTVRCATGGACNTKVLYSFFQ